MLFGLIFLLTSVSSMDIPIYLEMRPDSGCIIFTSRIHDTLDLDTIAYIDTNGIWHKYGKFSDSLWVKIIRGEYGVWASISTDIINSKDSTDIEFTDDAVFDSTVIVNDSIKAKDSGGIGLYDDSGTLGLHVEDGGCVGIGLSNPAVKFDVVGTHVSGIGIAQFKGTSSSGFISLNTTSAGESGFLLMSNNTLVGQFGIDGAGNRVYIKNRVFGTAEVISISSNGRVGINKVTPGAKFHVNGDVQIEDSLKLGEGDWIHKIVKIGSHAAILFGTDTMWLASDTTGF